MEQIKCTNCGAENRPTYRYCSRCGHELPKVEAKTEESDIQPTKNNDKRIKQIVGVIVGVAVAFLVQYLFFSPPTIDKALMKVASELNESCPIMIDQETRLDNALALPDRVFQYNYTLVNLESAEADTAQLKAYITPVLLNTIKTNPDLKTMRDNKVTMAYNYKDKNGAHLFKVAFTADQYNK